MFPPVPTIVPTTRELEELPDTIGPARGNMVDPLLAPATITETAPGIGL
jgi:hypothetical protein